MTSLISASPAPTTPATSGRVHFEGWSNPRRYDLDGDHLLLEVILPWCDCGTCRARGVQLGMTLLRKQVVATWWKNGRVLRLPAPQNGDVGKHLTELFDHPVRTL